jgi:hypothetical protein
LGIFAAVVKKTEKAKTQESRNQKEENNEVWRRKTITKSVHIHMKK